MAEKDADFQHKITHKAIELEANEKRRGQILVFLLVVLRQVFQQCLYFLAIRQQLPSLAEQPL